MMLKISQYTGILESYLKKMNYYIFSIIRPLYHATAQKIGHHSYRQRENSIVYSSQKCNFC